MQQISGYPIEIGLKSLQIITNGRRKQAKYFDLTKKILYNPQYIEPKQELPITPDKAKEENKENVITFDESELINDKENIHIQEYENFFTKYENYLTENINLFVDNAKILNKLPTIGPNIYDAFTDKHDAKQKGCKIIKTSLNPSTKTLIINYEDKKTLMNISSEFITNKFIIDKTKYFHFIIKCFNLFIEKINKLDFMNNIELHFIMKGGNLLKFLFETLTTKLNRRLSDWIKMEFGNYFNYSDFDFDFKILKINNTMTDNDYYYYRAIIINILNLFTLIIKNILLIEKEYFFSFFTDDEYTKIHNLDEYVKSLYNDGFKKIINEDKKNNKDNRIYNLFDDIIIEGVVFDYDDKLNVYSYYDHNIKQIIKRPIDIKELIKRDDFMIVNDYKGQNKMDQYKESININYDTFFNNILKLNSQFKHLYDIFNKHSSFYNTINGNLQFDLTNNNITQFSLMRIKIDFALKLKLKNNNIFYLRIPGELLDIASPTPNDYKFKKSIPENYEKILSKDIKTTIMVQSYQGMIYELLNILFVETNCIPWEDPKYGKRIQRLNLILILRLLVIEPEISDLQKIKFMESLYKNIKLHLNEKSNEYFEPKPSVNILFTKYFKQYYDLLIQVPEHKLSNEFKYNVFKNILFCITDKCIKILKTQYNYIHHRGEMYNINYYYGFT